MAAQTRHPSFVTSEMNVATARGTHLRRFMGGLGLAKPPALSTSLSSDLLTPEQVDALKLRAGDVRELAF